MVFSVDPTQFLYAFTMPSSTYMQRLEQTADTGSTEEERAN
jgi:hypothetical protein